MATKRTESWLTLAKVVEATGAPEEAIRAGVTSTSLDGWFKLTDEGLRFRPEVVEFVRWSSRLADAVAAGDVTLLEAARLFRRQSRRRSLSLPLDLK